MKSALVVTRWLRRRLASRYLRTLKRNRNEELQRLAEIKVWAATTISSVWRGTQGRAFVRNERELRKERWKQLFSDEEGRPFYYNQITGEVRWRKPQAVLDLEIVPICSNCDFHKAKVECADCCEFYCYQCWDAVHFGGRRAAHSFRSLFDYYDKRIDYGEGEFPSRWPSELEMDEREGWRLRISPLRRPKTVKDGWEVYEDEGSQRIFYYHPGLEQGSYKLPISNADDDNQQQQVEENYAPLNDDNQQEKEDKWDTAVPLEGGNGQQDDQHKKWSKHYYPEQDLHYYYDAVTGESTYDRPDFFKTQTISNDVDDNQQQQVEENYAPLNDDNQQEKEVKWDTAVVLEGGNGQQDDQHKQWSKHYYPEHDSHYYYDAVTGESTYERPDFFKM